MRKLKNGRHLHGDPNPAGGNGGGGGNTDTTGNTGLTEARVTTLIGDALGRFQESTLKPLTGQLTEFGAQFKTFLETQKPVPTPTGSTEEKPLSGDPHLNTELQRLTKLVESERKLREEAAVREKAAKEAQIKTDTDSKVKGYLNTFEFVDAEAREDAFQLIRDKIARDEEGNLIGPGNVMAEAWINDFIPAKKSHLLARSGGNGSGAAPQAGQRAGSQRVDLDSIKFGMSKEAAAAASSEIVRALKSQHPNK